MEVQRQFCQKIQEKNNEKSEKLKEAEAIISHFILEAKQILDSQTDLASEYASEFLSDRVFYQQKSPPKNILVPPLDLTNAKKIQDYNVNRQLEQQKIKEQQQLLQKYQNNDQSELQQQVQELQQQFQQQLQQELKKYENELIKGKQVLQQEMFQNKIQEDQIQDLNMQIQKLEEENLILIESQMNYEQKWKKLKFQLEFYQQFYFQFFQLVSQMQSKKNSQSQNLLNLIQAQKYQENLLFDIKYQNLKNKQQNNYEESSLKDYFVPESIYRFVEKSQNSNNKKDKKIQNQIKQIEQNQIEFDMYSERFQNVLTDRFYQPYQKKINQNEIYNQNQIYNGNNFDKNHDQYNQQQFNFINNTVLNSILAQNYIMDLAKQLYQDINFQKYCLKQDEFYYKQNFNMQSQYDENNQKQNKNDNNNNQKRKQFKKSSSDPSIKLNIKNQDEKTPIFPLKLIKRFDKPITRYYKNKYANLNQNQEIKDIQKIKNAFKEIEELELEIHEQYDDDEGRINFDNENANLNQNLKTNFSQASLFDNNQSNFHFIFSEKKNQENLQNSNQNLIFNTQSRSQ
ncbi:hypothetical protein PPERSA_03890 [Pseudocohnilembus persalinus]|uniref:Uncharacterized protein n=1 Tax=Pseudocohnilembus persalinus TaxID=266149 RepID=A0A0V0Q937_PSEPJ|nr:hypothetical protein PPERSA_03890 [Pseudocohnilembus persalinus]|eukprot:KRW98755.1 hypothetical protein PPERSA_03890 [Pseudocohnilembus persalinus]